MRGIPRMVQKKDSQMAAVHQIENPVLWGVSLMALRGTSERIPDTTGIFFFFLKSLCFL